MFLDSMKVFYVVFFFGFTVILYGQNVSYIATNDAKEDLNFMIKTIEKVHYSPYFKESKTSFEAFKMSLYSKSPEDSIPLKSFIRVGMQLAAKLIGGHTALDWQNANLIPRINELSVYPLHW
jgi:hypothetical protein